MAPRSKDLGRATVVSLAAAAGAVEAVPGSVLTAFGATAPVCAVAASAPKKITDRTGFKRIVASVRMVFRGLKSVCRIEKPVNGLTAHVADLVSKALLQSEVPGPGFLLLRRAHVVPHCPRNESHHHDRSSGVLRRGGLGKICGRQARPRVNRAR